MDAKLKLAAALSDDGRSINKHSPGNRPLSPSPTGRFSLRRSSQISSPSSSISDLDTSDVSCVARETSQEQCSRHRFIVWAAVKRNSCPRMTDDERLECPLLRCTSRFANHEVMLRHLVECEHLSSCEYWCYDHMRVERFDDSKCKKCLGHPSKRRKMLHMAKNFFSSLGHKSRKEQGFEYDPAETMSVASVAPPPRYEEINPEPSIELLGTEMPVEIDSTEVRQPAFVPTPPPPPPQTQAAIDPQALLLPELDSTAITANPFMPWNTTPMISEPECGPSRTCVPKPALQLTTQGMEQFRHAPRPRPIAVPTSRSKNLSPSSSVRSTTSTMSNISSVISPISNWSYSSNQWSNGLETNLTSPATDLMPAAEFLTEDMFTNDVGILDDSFVSKPHGDVFSELPADIPMPKLASDVLSADSFLFPYNNMSANVSYDKDVVLTEESLDSLAFAPEPESEDLTCYSETTGLVGSTWEFLLEHVLSSLAKTHHMKGNSLIDQLQSLSARGVASAGLSALKNALEGRSPQQGLDVLCLVHLVYAFSLATYGHDAPSRCQPLFQQSLGYARFLVPQDRDAFIQTVVSLWQPSDMSQTELSRHLQQQCGHLRRSGSQRGKEPEARLGKYDALLDTARHFLDEIEMSAILGQTPTVEVLTSELYITHLQVNGNTSANSAFGVTVNFILGVLLQTFPDAQGLAGKLNAVHQRVSSGSARSVRYVELELLRAGKSSMESSKFFHRFVPELRELCNPLYLQHEPEGAQRVAYYGHGLALVEDLMSGMDTTGTDAAATLPHDMIFPMDTVGPADAGAALQNDQDFDEFINTFSTLDETDTAPLLQNMAVESSEAASEAMVDSDMPSSDSAPSSSATGVTSSSSSTPASSDHAHKPGAYDCCDLCGYRPKGDPQWFRGSMAKHKKLQHSALPPKIYKCPFPGCTSQYRNRPDNLKQHQNEKNHWVGEDAVARKGRKQEAPAGNAGVASSAGKPEAGASEAGETTRRPSKRKKVSE